MSTIPVMPHRNSISKRSSFHSKQGIDSNSFNIGRNEQQRKNVKGVTGHGQNEMKNTMTRLDYLNRKFNVNPSFDIEISGDEEENDGNNDDTKHDSNEIQHIDIPYDTELININVKQKQIGIDEMSKNLDESISLLSPLFEYIQNFETNLQKLSNEMEVLQTRLIKLDDEIKQNSKLDNLLTPILNDLLISPSCIKMLVHHIIDEQWVNQLIILQEKKEILQNYENNERVNNNNIIELVNLIDKLEIKCVERIKFFLIENIKYLRSVNASSIKVQNKLLKVKEIFKFLENKNSKLAKEFEMAYIYTIRWYYYFNFVKYINSLESLKILENDYDIENNSNDKNNANSNLNSTSRSLSLDNSNSINEYLINLPKRFEQMNDENNKFSILGQIAESNNVNNSMKFFMEQIFQFLNQTMMDNFTIEFNFIVEFFHLKQSENLNNMTKQIFSPILKLGNNFTKYLVNNCKSDYFGILYTIRKIQRMEYEIQNRCLPEIFENYLNTQLLLLWPVFQRNVDTLCHNITSTLSSTLIIKQVVNNKNNILIPLKLTQSFSMIISNLEKLVQKLVFELETSEPLNRSIDRLSNTFEKGIVHLASSLDESKRRLFLYVNFELVFNVLDSGNDELSTLCDHYKKLVEAYV
jgi:hypothetical protein